MRPFAARICAVADAGAHSCGFSASQYEYDGVAGQCRVPPAFFHRFTRDACKLADAHAQGRLVSILEGGYSDRALLSGAMAHVAGLTYDDAKIDQAWWSEVNLIEVRSVFFFRSGRALTARNAA